MGDKEYHEDFDINGGDGDRDGRPLERHGRGDDALGRRLADALRTEAGSVAPGADAWSRFQDRIATASRIAPDTPTAEADGVGPGPDVPEPAVSRASPLSAGGIDNPVTAVNGTGRAKARARWRVPLLAAAAVVAVAVVTSAIVTGGFGAGRQQPGAGVPGGAGSVAVPIVTGLAAGTAGGSNIGGTSEASPTGASPPVPAPAGTGAAGAAGSVLMSFVGGQPPQADLRATFVFPGEPTAGGGDHASDGTALGYVTQSGGIPDGARYAWGAVGPGVSQLQFTISPIGKPGDLDPNFSGGPSWTIDGGAGTPFSLPEAADSAWTDLTDRWHGFAVQLPADTRSVTIVAVGDAGQMLQQRRFNIASGQHSDLPTATATTPGGQAPPLVPIGTTYAPESSVIGPSTSHAPTTGLSSSANPGAPGASGSSNPGTDSPNGPNGPFVVTYQDKPGEPGMAALLQGTVGVVGGCVAMVDPGSGTAYTLVFPRSQVGAAVPPAVLHFRGKNYTEGTALSVAGGEWGPDYPGAPATCPETAWLVSPYD